MSGTFAVTTPDGPATISVVSHETGVLIYPAKRGHHGDITGDRFVLRSAVAGLPDMFAVAERFSGERSRWQFVTDDLTVDEAASWQKHRQPGAYVGRALEAWFSGDAARPEKDCTCTCQIAGAHDPDCDLSPLAAEPAEDTP